jgi:DNA-binding XRE family transcriptional regulator
MNLGETLRAQTHPNELGIVDRARVYLAANAAESGADVLLTELIARVEELEGMPKPTPQRLAKLMRQWRAAKGLSVTDAGDALGLSARTIEGIEQGRGFNAPRVLEIALTCLLTNT